MTHGAVEYLEWFLQNLRYLRVFFCFSISSFVLNESPTRPAPSSSHGGSIEGTVSAAGQGLPQPPPGMSVYAVKRVVGEAQWSAEQLEQVQ